MMAEVYTRKQVNELIDKLLIHNVDSREIDAVLQKMVGKTRDKYYAAATQIDFEQATELTTLAGGALNTLLVQSLAGALTEATKRL